MRIEVFTPDRAGEVRQFVLGVLEGEGFGYDPVKDSDLKDICGYYIDNGGVFYIGTIKGVVVGTGAVRRINSKKCEIKRIYVKPEFRGRGFGKKLFLMALEFARTHYHVVTLKTDRTFVEAINMYQKHGFSVVNENDDTLFFLYRP
ncbi:MAG: GNAT family N-acetyltransferase [ANME-2 cluster archaeon]|nr:GNAT family N-acetyltransferase [ANME-2 cluster archaeon]MBC2700797.1 GNAT family N-acetyltransferase [ANME-2 cluster archaeon]MBC2745879.1 GNAT family N-acetyltransferase [ANME-2 cluster archaeon]MBC2764064.1 GNAT family N-acetyltransferase [ANME-2 cluster archaeon]